MINLNHRLGLFLRLNFTVRIACYVFLHSRLARGIREEGNLTKHPAAFLSPLPSQEPLAFFKHDFFFNFSSFLCFGV